MSKAGRKWLFILLGVGLVGGALIAGQGQKSPGGAAKSSGPAAAPKASGGRAAASSALSEAALLDKVARYVRERFGTPSNIQITADPLKPSIHPYFDETTIYTDNGTKKNPNMALISKDQRLLVLGRLFPVTSEPKADLIAILRQQFNLPATTAVTATDFRPSSFPNLLVTTVSVADPGKPVETQDLFMTADRKVLVVGGIFNLVEDRRKLALQMIKTANQPRLGPATAPVTIVEYSDLQCPMCARMHDFLENDVAKKYSGKVQIFFKEFPLTQIHDWTMTASIANQCVYQIQPSAYLPFRTLIFRNQQGTTAANARDLMLSYGEQLGIDRLRLAACIDSKASLPRVEANFVEGKTIGVQSTPTTFINGKMVVGMPNIDEFHKEIDAALKARR
jgi:protein-disulfide isomerase